MNALTEKKNGELSKVKQVRLQDLKMVMSY